MYSGTCCWIWFGCNGCNSSARYEIYGIAVCLGAYTSSLLTCSLSMIGSLIGSNIGKNKETINYQYNPVFNSGRSKNEITCFVNLMLLF